MKYNKAIHILLCLFLCVNLYAQAPETLNYQGLLNDNSGFAVPDANYTLTFNIYNVSTGGAALWTESQTVTTKNGIFSAILGTKTRLNIEFDDQLYLGITIDGKELTPRTTLTSTPYTSNLPKIAIIKDIKANGTKGGAFVSGAWRTRDLNDLSGNTDFIGLLSNQFRLEEGKYLIEAEAPAYSVDLHKIRLYNITDATTEIIGNNAGTSSSDATQTIAKLIGEITITDRKVFEIQHRATSTNINGLGAPTSFGEDEIYTIVKITKISN